MLLKSSIKLWDFWPFWKCVQKHRVFQCFGMRALLGGECLRGRVMACDQRMTCDEWMACDQWMTCDEWMVCDEWMACNQWMACGQRVTCAGWMSSRAQIGAQMKLKWSPVEPKAPAACPPIGCCQVPLRNRQHSIIGHAARECGCLMRCRDQNERAHLLKNKLKHKKRTPG